MTLKFLYLPTIFRVFDNFIIFLKLVFVKQKIWIFIFWYGIEAMIFENYHCQNLSTFFCNGVRRLRQHKIWNFSLSKYSFFFVLANEPPITSHRPTPSQMLDWRIIDFCNSIVTGQSERSLRSVNIEEW